jgi:hypothetical protein
MYQSMNAPAAVRPIDMRQVATIYATDFCHPCVMRAIFDSAKSKHTARGASSTLVRMVSFTTTTGSTGSDKMATKMKKGVAMSTPKNRPTKQHAIRAGYTAEEKRGILESFDTEGA